MKELKPKSQCVLYARKSTEEDDKQVMSIEAQLFELREFAERERIEIVKEFTEAKSAKKPGRDDPGAMPKYRAVFCSFQSWKAFWQIRLAQASLRFSLP